MDAIDTAGPDLSALAATAAQSPHAPRVDYMKVSPDAVRAQFGMEQFVRKSGLEHSLVELVKLCASYINGCAYCVDMHTNDALAAGETAQRLLAVPVWRETPFFTARERAALAWTETVTDVSRTGVPDEAYEQVRRHFDEAGVVSLTMAIITINGWNRLAITFRAPVGTYQPPAARTS